MFPFMNIQILMEEIIKQESKAVIISAEMLFLSLIVSPSKDRPRYSSVQCKQNHSSISFEEMKLNYLFINSLTMEMSSLKMT